MKAEMRKKLMENIEIQAMLFVKANSERSSDRIHDTAMGYINAVEDIYGKDIAKAMENRFWKIALG